MRSEIALARTEMKEAGRQLALDGVKHKFRPRMVALLPANHRLSCWNDPKNPMEQLWFHFDARIMGLVDLFQAVLCPAPFVERGSHTLKGIAAPMELFAVE